MKITKYDAKKIPAGTKLFAHELNSPLGTIVILASDKHLYLLEFATIKDLDSEIAFFKKNGFDVNVGVSPVTQLIEQELVAYFKGELQGFTTPVIIFGTPFQQRVWEALTQIPYGTTISYKELAGRVDKPTGFRAVANSNGRNKISIVIPCHRVINHNGKLGGYGGGLDRKTYLLALEKGNEVIF